MYLTFEKYQEIGGGSIQDEVTFRRKLFFAESLINRITFGRLRKLVSESRTVPECVLYALAEMVDYAAKVESDGGILTSETVSKHSKTFANEGSAGGVTLESKMSDKAKVYLAGSEYEWMLYRGFLPLDVM